MVDLCNPVDSIVPGLAVWANPKLLEAIPTTLPLADAVDLLTGKANPERILAERRAVMKLHEEEMARELAATSAKQRQEKDDADALERDRRQYDGRGWDEAPDWQRLCYALALRVEGRDSALADDLRDSLRQAEVSIRRRCPSRASAGGDNDARRGQRRKRGARRGRVFSVWIGAVVRGDVDRRRGDRVL